MALLFIQDISLFLKEFHSFALLLLTKNNRISSPGFLGQRFNNQRAALFTSSVQYKKPGKIYCSTFWGHLDSIIKRLVKLYANKEKYKISTEITINGLRCLFRPFIVISVLILYFSLFAYNLTSLLIMSHDDPETSSNKSFLAFYMPLLQQISTDQFNN